MTQAATPALSSSVILSRVAERHDPGDYDLLVDPPGVPDYPVRAGQVAVSVYRASRITVTLMVLGY